MRFIRLLVVLLTLTATQGVVGCGGEDAPLTQPKARDQAANAICDYAGRCGNIGEAKTYLTRDACLTTWKGTIEGLWPPAECKKIVQANFDTCVASVNNSACDNGLDVLTVLSKCGKDTICAVP